MLILKGRASKHPVFAKKILYGEHRLYTKDGHSHSAIDHLSQFCSLKHFDCCYLSLFLL